MKDNEPEQRPQKKTYRSKEQVDLQGENCRNQRVHPNQRKKKNHQDERNQQNQRPPRPPRRNPNNSRNQIHQKHEGHQISQRHEGSERPQPMPKHERAPRPERRQRNTINQENVRHNEGQHNQRDRREQRNYQLERTKVDSRVVQNRQVQTNQNRRHQSSLCNNSSSQNKRDQQVKIKQQVLYQSGLRLSDQNNYQQALGIYRQCWKSLSSNYTIVGQSEERKIRELKEKVLLEMGRCFTEEKEYKLGQKFCDNLLEKFNNRNSQATLIKIKCMIGSGRYREVLAKIVQLKKWIRKEENSEVDLDQLVVQIQKKLQKNSRKNNLQQQKKSNRQGYQSPSDNESPIKQNQNPDKEFESQQQSSEQSWHHKSDYKELSDGYDQSEEYSDSEYNEEDYLQDSDSEWVSCSSSNSSDTSNLHVLKQKQLYDQAIDLYYNGQQKEAIEVFLRCQQQLQHNYPNPSQQQAELIPILKQKMLLAMGRCSMEQMDWPKARKYFAEVVKNNPNNFEAVFQKTMSMIELNELFQAQKHIIFLSDIYPAEKYLNSICNVIKHKKEQRYRFPPRPEPSPNLANKQAQYQLNSSQQSDTNPDLTNQNQNPNSSRINNVNKNQGKKKKKNQADLRNQIIKAQDLKSSKVPSQKAKDLTKQIKIENKMGQHFSNQQKKTKRGQRKQNNIMTENPIVAQKPKIESPKPVSTLQNPVVAEKPKIESPKPVSTLQNPVVAEKPKIESPKPVSTLQNPINVIKSPIQNSEITILSGTPQSKTLVETNGNKLNLNELNKKHPLSFSPSEIEMKQISTSNLKSTNITKNQTMFAQKCMKNTINSAYFDPHKKTEDIQKDSNQQKFMNLDKIKDDQSQLNTQKQANQTHMIGSHPPFWIQKNQILIQKPYFSMDGVISRMLEQKLCGTYKSITMNVKKQALTNALNLAKQIQSIFGYELDRSLLQPSSQGYVKLILHMKPSLNNRNLSSTSQLSNQNSKKISSLDYSKGGQNSKITNANQANNKNESQPNGAKQSQTEQIKEKKKQSSCLIY